VVQLGPGLHQLLVLLLGHLDRFALGWHAPAAGRPAGPGIRAAIRAAFWFVLA